MNRKKCHSVLQDEGFTNKKYKVWIAKTKNKKTAWFTICQKEIDLSTVGSAALDSHAFSKKHTKMIDYKQGLDTFFRERVTVSESSATCQSSKKSLSASNKIDSVFDKDNSTNTEILWTLYF